MQDYIELLKREVKPAFGCTEPIALAFASAKAAELLGVTPDHIHGRLSGNIIKNAKSVTIPNSEGRTGIYYSLILGALVGTAEKELEVLEDVTHEQVVTADRLFAADFCSIELAEGVENLYIEVVATAGEHTSKVIVQNTHTTISYAEKDGQVLIALTPEEVTKHSVELCFDSCYEFAMTVDAAELEDILGPQLDLNMAIAEEGMKNNYGSNIGKLIISNSTSIADKARAYAAAGSDARMDGCSMPVMINCGSGNQGITLSVPIMMYAKEYDVPRDHTLRSLALANVLALYIKQYIGRLSAYCGVVSAASATAAGVAFLMKESKEVVWETLSNALAGTSGVVCDGAKASCAMKIGMSLGNSLLAYTQAKTKNSFKAGQGIVKETIDDTVQTVATIAREGMKETDVVILETMLEK
ncbi:serine dehydratase subunit alpha family protein [Veillonella sp. CHU740]|uniref:L-cysteine desulfidase family protein n=1 Tax=Veillonella sp. CHU740 TaxID=2490950 RepID=UPI000F8F30F8|nr:L-serine ammonia-lyase, iron-sulfur-dependent, subunit alpha [Veillonella sp. CHU740]